MDQEDMECSSDDDVDESQSPKNKNCNEACVVSTPNASIQPLAVMIASVDTIIAQPTMSCSRGSVSPAGGAVLYPEHVLSY